MDAATRGRIDRYCPSSVRLSSAALEVCREAVRRAGPSDPQEAALLLHAAAQHVAWTEGRGVPVRLSRVFAADQVDASVAAFAASGHRVSPFRSRVERVAGAVTRRPASVRHETETAKSDLDPPYTPRELAGFGAAAGALQVESATCLRAAIALGVGAGVVGPAASRVSAAHLRRVGGTLVVCAPGVGPVAVREPWGRRLLEVAQRRPEGPLTSYYDSAGRQRLQRALKRLDGVPRLEVHRLRTTWVVSLLEAGLPVDVVAHVAGVGGSALHRHVALLPGVTADRLACWMTDDPRKVPDSSPFAGLEPVAAPGRAAEDVAALVTDFRPGGEAAGDRWEHETVVALRARIVERASSEKRARKLLTALSLLVGWAATEPGLPFEPAALLKDSTLQRWAGRQRAAGAEDSSVATHLSALRSLATPVDPPVSDAPPRTKPAGAAVYDADEVERLWAATAVDGPLTEPQRRLLTAYLVLQLGVGLRGHEAVKVRSSDVELDGQLPWVHVTGTPGRRVPAATWAMPLLAQLAEVADDGYLTGYGSTRLTGPRRRIEARLGLPVDPARLRRTWLTGQLEAGVPADVLAALAGGELVGIDPLLARLPRRDLPQLVAYTATVA